MFELKPLSRDAVPRALEKAERYRLLNEPGEAESICLDVLRVDPEQPAGAGHAAARAHRPVRRRGRRRRGAARARGARRASRTSTSAPTTPGIISERRAKAQLSTAAPARATWPTSGSARRWAGTRRPRPSGPPGNDDALLRWNTCARLLERLPRARAQRDGGVRGAAGVIAAAPDPRRSRAVLPRRLHAGGAGGARRAGAAERAAPGADVGPHRSAGPRALATASASRSSTRRATIAGHRHHGAGRARRAGSPAARSRPTCSGSGSRAPARRPGRARPSSTEHPQRRLRAALRRRRLDVRRRGRARPGLDDVARQPAQPEARHRAATPSS